MDVSQLKSYLSRNKNQLAQDTSVGLGSFQSQDMSQPQKINIPMMSSSSSANADDNQAATPEEQAKKDLAQDIANQKNPLATNDSSFLGKLWDSNVAQPLQNTVTEIQDFIGDPLTQLQNVLKQSGLDQNTTQTNSAQSSGNVDYFHTILDRLSKGNL